MLLRLLFLSLSISFYAFGEDVPRAPLLSSIDSEPSSIIDGCVNVISGSFFEHDVDLVVPGPEVLKVERLLINNNMRPCLGNWSGTQGKWNFNDVQFLASDRKPAHKNHTQYKCNFHGVLGDSLSFSFMMFNGGCFGHDAYINMSMLKHGHINTAKGVIGGVTNVRNNILNYYGSHSKITKSDGSQLTFGLQTHLYDSEFGENCSSQLLEEEILPNYLKKNYTFNANLDLTEYSLRTWGNTTLSTLRRQTANVGSFKEVTYTAPDGRWVLYRFVDDAKGAGPYSGSMGNWLHEVVRSDKPPIQYVYALPRAEDVKYSNHNGSKRYFVQQQMIGKAYPDHRTVWMGYYIKESIKARREVNTYRASRTSREPYDNDVQYVEEEVDNAGPEFGRIKTLHAPLGADATPIQKYHFQYHLPAGGGGCTGVIDALNRKTDYSFNQRNRLTAVVKYDVSGAPYTVENLYWGPQDTHKEIELITRTFGLFGSPFKAFSKAYGYDISGNVVLEYLSGNLTGKNESSTLLVDANGNPIPGTSDCLIKSHEYTQDKYHLLTKTTVGLKSTRNVFIPNTNLLAACFHADAGKTYLRHFYYYNDTGMVIKHLIDDGVNDDVNDLTGVTERKIELIERTESYPVGFPLVVTELCLDLKTGVEHLLGRKINTYDKSGRLLQEDIYGNDGFLALSKSWEYDAHGNVIKEVRADGAIITRGYDLNDNMILEVGPNPLLIKQFSYDYMNRLIKIEEHHPDAILSKHFRYDLCGNLLAKVDAMGTETRTHYDDFNRPIILEGAEISDPQGSLYRPVTRYEYNELSLPTKIIAPDGSVTEFAYTLYGKPCKIAYPDGSIERFEYDLEGRLIKETAKNGSAKLYSYDAQNRIIQTIQLTSTGEVAYQTSSCYSTFHLLEKTDPEGYVTYYNYDCYGRMTSERKGECVTNYEYDALNRCCKTTIDGSAKCVRINSMGQVVEERTENLKGDVLALIRYAYDVDGNKVRIEQDSEAGLIVATLSMDTHGVPLESVDPEGNVTRTRLFLDYFNAQGQRVIRTETTDPLGMTTVQIKDAQGRLAEQIRLDSYGKEIQKTAYVYNSAGSCIQTTETVFRGEETAPDVINFWEYNSVNQLVSMTQGLGQPEEKRVSYSYNRLGQLESTMKPDGVSLQYYYDGLGRLIEETADNHSIHHRYTYDIRSNPVQVENLANHTVTSRQYDEHNRITLEKLANGLEMQIIYNPDGGLKKVTLPDLSSIDYIYNGPLLTNVERKTPNGTTQYQHTYNAYDLSGNPLEASLINNLGELTSRYTLKGQPKEQKTDYYSESLTYDPMNNIISKSYQDTLGQESNKYAYDSLNQMKEESGHFSHQYTNDSLYNRSSKDGKKYTLNSLNSLLSDGEADYSYDACGNVTAYTKNNKSYSFKYDALDRLTTLKIDATTYAYTYDEQNRCITRQVTSGDTLSEKILFVGQCDIGTTDLNGKIKNLRVIGKGKGAEIGAAIAIELNGEVFAPLHDHQGNVIALIDSSGKPQESYRYSAFGEEAIFDASGTQITDSEIGNPWRFSSKRKEADFNLFGRRFYNPDLGRWLTPDPIGHEAGPNLYAYVSNSPLSHIDLFGFLEEEEKGISFASLREFCRDTWNSCRDFISRGFESAKEGVSTLGRGVSAIGHEIPFPEAREVVRMIGHAMENGTLRGFEFSYNLNRSGCYSLGRQSDTNNKVGHVLLNGMNNTLEAVFKVAEEESARFDNCNVHIGYNGTSGTLWDFAECIIHKLGVKNEAVDAAVTAIRKGIYDAGGVGNGGVVKIHNHSQAGLILDLALTFFTDDEKSMFYITTFGSAKLINPNGLESCINYVSKNEWVSWFADYPGYRAAQMGLRPDVIFLEPIEEGWVEHGINCKTYEEARDNDAKRFRKRYLQ